MGLTTIDGSLLKKMIIAGANELAKNKDEIDALNVFPVPDGDTGTNMSLTLLAAAKEVYKLKSPSISDVGKAVASGSLRGARGNSGVILSQLFRGFAKGLEGKAVITASDLAAAFSKATETAYKAVMKPKEGTILTVASALAQKANECAENTKDIEEMMRGVMKHAEVVLENTTNMLPALKQAGVVDAGGKGLLCVLYGAIKSRHVIDDIEVYEGKGEAAKTQPMQNAAMASNENITFGYCTEIIVEIKEATEELEDRFKKYLSTIGDSIVVVADGNIMKIHVHTENPGLVLEYALKEGPLTNIKIENMREQHSNLIEFSGNENGSKDKKEIEEILGEEKEVGFIAIAAGQGLSSIFKNLGVDVVIEGGQTMNPSADDILDAAKKINSKNIIVLPNNKNIILAANQAAELCTTQKIHVVPTKTVPQGVTAMINFAPALSLEENIESMAEASTTIATGQVTYAVRATVVNDRSISEGDYLCLIENNIEIVGKDLQDSTKKLVDTMLSDGGEFITVYYGSDVSEEKASEIQAYIEENYPDCDVELHNGSQPLYYYIISVE